MVYDRIRRAAKEQLQTVQFVTQDHLVILVWSVSVKMLTEQALLELECGRVRFDPSSLLLLG